VIDLGTLDGFIFSAAYDINDRGQIVGESHGPVMWRDGIATRLPVGDAVPEFGSPSANNDRGDIVGWLGYMGIRNNRAVVWRHGVPTDLNLEGGNSTAYDINDRGQIVGWWELVVPMGCAGAYVWERGRVTSLPSLTGNGGSAAGINNRGEIVGVSPIPNDPDPTGNGHAVLWR
jgi:uncharacterized membrane protein